MRSVLHSRSTSVQRPSDRGPGRHTIIAGMPLRPWRVLSEVRRARSLSHRLRRARVVSRPMPEYPPVTIATLPLRCTLWSVSRGDGCRSEAGVDRRLFTRHLLSPRLAGSKALQNYAAVCKMILPMDSRLSNLRCASTAFANGNTLSMCRRSQPSRIPSSTSFARRNNSSRVRVKWPSIPPEIEIARQSSETGWMRSGSPSAKPWITT